MDRFDRLFGILLLLREGRPVAAGALADRFGVSRRTIYRDLDVLGLAGVPVYAARGRGGGIRLLDGYFLPPLMFAEGEAIALLVGLALLRGARAAPYVVEADMAARKLLAAVPARVRAVLEHVERVVGVEPTPADIFHPEPDDEADTPAMGATPEGETVTRYLQALLAGRAVHLRYRSPYREGIRDAVVLPLGLLRDRDRWYLAGQPEAAPGSRRLWRADRVVTLTPGQPVTHASGGFDVRDLMERPWLQAAMDTWRAHAPVRIHVTEEQAQRLRQDWYYRHARFDQAASGGVIVTFGESNPTIAFALLRWLGPEAELVTPEDWRELFRAELRQMLARHGDAHTP